MKSSITFDIRTINLLGVSNYRTDGEFVECRIEGESIVIDGRQKDVRYIRKLEDAVRIEEFVEKFDEMRYERDNAHTRLCQLEEYLEDANSCITRLNEDKKHLCESLYKANNRADRRSEECERLQESVDYWKDSTYRTEIRLNAIEQGLRDMCERYGVDANE